MLWILVFVLLLASIIPGTMRFGWRVVIWV